MGITLAELEQKVTQNEKEILLLKAQQKGLCDDMAEIKKVIVNEFKSLNNKIIGGMGVIIMFLAGLIFIK